MDFCCGSYRVQVRCGRLFNAGIVLGDNSEQLFDPLDAQKLAVKIRQHLMQPEIRIKAQKWGQEYSATFDTKIVGAKLLEIYHQALRKRLVR